MNTQPKLKPFKVVFDHGTHCEITNPEGEMKRYTHEQVKSLKALMPEFSWHTVVFKDYSSAAR